MGKSNSIVEDGLEEMEKILKGADVGRVTLYDGSMPYIVPVNFLYHEGKVVFHCAWEGKKLEVIAANPRCCFEADEFVGEVGDHFGARCHLDYDSVLAFGEARIESDAGEKARLLQFFAEKYSEDYRRPVSEGGNRFNESPASECCCVVIDVEEPTGRRERTVEGKRQKIMWQHRF